MPYCRNCGYEYVAGATVCPDCGTTLSQGEQSFCETCEEPLPARSVFCPHCGVLRAADKNVSCETHKGKRASGRCVVCGKTLCDECAVKKNGRMFCGNDEHVKMAFDWVSVWTTSTEYEAQMIRANLEGAGIPATVLSQHDRMYFTTVGDLAVSEVMVPKRFADDARRYMGTVDPEGGKQ